MDAQPIIDEARLHLICGGDAALAEELLDDLLAESDEVLQRLRAASEGGVADLAHLLKGMATEIGAPRLQAAAHALEEELEPGSVSYRLAAVIVAVEEIRRWREP
jgi:HPt (histidine-containing phosphotransfer) domain-containing protein